MIGPLGLPVTSRPAPANPQVSPATLRADFDRLAPYADDGWSHNSHYHAFLLRHVPRGGLALDIGCGAGAFARQLASRADRVLGLDLSPEMVRRARARSRAYPGIQVAVADVLACDFPPATFDTIAAIATLHHMDLAAVLNHIAAWLKPGGVFVALDLYEAVGARDMLLSTLAVPTSTLYRVARTGRLRESDAAHAVWAAHGVHDRYLTVADASRIASRALPGAVVRQHLLWRYSLVWRSPLASPRPAQLH